LASLINERLFKGKINLVNKRKHNFNLVLISIILIIAINSNIAQAANLLVNSDNGTVADDGVCSIVEAIISANTNSSSGTSSGECIAGDDINGLDTINLSSNITLSDFFEDNAINGKTGTPYITSSIIINGMGFTLQRDNSLACNNDDVSDSTEFRLLHIASNGTLLLNHIELSHGCVSGNIDSNKFFGGALSNSGILSLKNSQITNNTAGLGGGISNGGRNFQGTITNIQNTLFSGNNASQYGGGGLANYHSVISSIQNSTFFANSARVDGGGISNIGTIESIFNSTFSNNTTSILNGGGINNILGTIGLIRNSTFSGNSAVSGGGINAEFSSLISLMNNNLFHENTGTNADCNIVNDSSIYGINNLSNQGTNNCITANITNGLTASTVGPLTDNDCVKPLANGTCVLTHALLAGSEAIDASDAYATAIDQRGYIAEGIRDIGAYEIGASTSDLISSHDFEEND
jgi:hypothetical protein